MAINRKPINQLIREALAAEGANPDYDKVVTTVLDSISPVDHKYYLGELIKLRIPSLRTTDRVQAFNSLRNYDATSEKPSGPLLPEPQTVLDIDGPAPKLVREAPKSVKLDAIRSRVLGSRIPVEDGSTKFIKDMDYDDLLFVAQVRRDMAKANNSSADMYVTIADTLQNKGLTVVSELPDKDFDSLVNPSLI